MLKIQSKKNGEKSKKRREDEIGDKIGETDIRVRNGNKKKEIRQNKKKTKRKCRKERIKEEVKENQPALRAGWDGNDKNRSINNQKNYASKDKNSSSLIILTPSSFAFLFLEEAEAESLLIR